MGLKRWHMWVAVSLLTLSCLYGYKHALVRAAVNQFVLPPTFSITCLSWSFNAFNKIEITQLCVEHDEFSMRISDVIASVSEINVTKMEIKHRRKASASGEFQARPLNIPLLANRPLLNIDNISVISEALADPLSFSLQETALNEFLLAGDIHAQLSLAGSSMTTSIELISPLVQRYSAPYLNRLKGKLLLTYDGMSAQIYADIQAVSAYLKPQCRSNTQVSGSLSAEIDLQTPLALIDLSQMQTKVTLNKCQSGVPEAYIGYVQSTLNQPYVITLPNQLVITPSTMIVPKVIATNASSDEITIQNFQMQLASMDLDFVGRWHHHSNTLGQLTNDVTIKVQDRQFTSEHQIRFQAPQVAINNRVFHENTFQAQLTVASDLAFDRVSISGSGEAHSNRATQVDSQFDAVNLAFDFSGAYAEQYQLEANFTLISDAITVQDNQLDDLVIEAGLSIDAQQQLDISVRSSAAQLHLPTGQIDTIKQQFALRSQFDIDELKSGDLSIEINGNTRIDALLLAGIRADNIKVETQGHFNRTLSLEHIVEYADLSVLLEHQLLSQRHPFTITVAEQPIQSLQPLLIGIAPKLQLSSGTINGKIHGDIHTQDASFSAELSDASVLYDSHYVENIITAFSGELSSGEINIIDSKLKIEQVRSGAVLSNLSADYMLNAQGAIVSNITANVFNGQVFLPQFALFSEQQDLEVLLSNLDLGMLTEAGRDAGIALSGKVSGKLPISLNNGAVSIQNGQLYNVDVGQLLVQNNASVDALKAQQPSLETVIGLLDNLTVNTLMSDVNLTPDGWLTLGVKITGENEAQAQPVNFNYTHSENIFTLFRALRLSDEITQRVEQALTKSE